MQKSSAVKFHSEIASQFDERYAKSSQFRERKELWERFIQKYSPKNSRALDLGCGSGVLTVSLAHYAAEVVAIDGSSVMLALCKDKLEKLELTNVQIIESDIRELSKHQLGKFDLIICSSVIEYLDNIDECIQMMSSLLKPSGHFIFSVQNRTSLYRKLEFAIHKLTGHPKYFGHVKHLVTQIEIKEKLNQQRFQILTHEYFGKTPVLSNAFRRIGLSQFSDNLLLIVASSTK